MDRWPDSYIQRLRFKVAEKVAAGVRRDGFIEATIYEEEINARVSETWNGMTLSL